MPEPEPITFSSLYMGYHQQIVTDGPRVSPYAVEMPAGARDVPVAPAGPDPVRDRAEGDGAADWGSRGHLFERRDYVSSGAYWCQGSAEGDGANCPD